MNLLTKTKKYLITKKLAKQSFLKLDQAYIEQEKVLKERVEKYGK